MDKKLEAELRELLDKQALYELIMAYANAADRHDHDKMRALYHEDAIDEHGHFAKGPAMEFIDQLPKIQAPMAILHHNVTTVNLKLAGDKAEGEVYLIAFHQVKGRRAPARRADRRPLLRQVRKARRHLEIQPSLDRRRLAYAADPSTVRLDHPSSPGPMSASRGRSIRPTASSSCSSAASVDRAAGPAARLGL